MPIILSHSLSRASLVSESLSVYLSIYLYQHDVHLSLPLSCSQSGGRVHGPSSEGYLAQSGTQAGSAVLFKGSYFYSRRAECSQGTMHTLLANPRNCRPFLRGYWYAVLQCLGSLCGVELSRQLMARQKARAQLNFKVYWWLFYLRSRQLKCSIVFGSCFLFVFVYFI